MQFCHSKSDIERYSGDGESKLFSSAANREKLEKIFTEVGVEKKLAYEDGSNGPMGMKSKGREEGFGSPVVTYRNCPNTAPLVLWGRNKDWLPLFPRKVKPRGIDHPQLRKAMLGRKQKMNNPARLREMRVEREKRGSV